MAGKRLIRQYGEGCTKRKFWRKDKKIFFYARHHHRGETRFYWCMWCRCWHLTSQEKE